jgi:transglutaminase-like putative cysteine protease
MANSSASLVARRGALGQLSGEMLGAGWRQVRHNLLPLGLMLLMFLTLTWSIESAAWSSGLYMLHTIGAAAVVTGFLLGLSRWPALLCHAYSLVAGFITLLLVTCNSLPARIPWSERAVEVVLRVQHWVDVLVNRQINYDNLVFVIQLALYLWLFAYLSSWQLFRKGRVGWAVVPCGAGLLFNLYYAPPQLTLYFLVYLTLALVLVVSSNYRRREQLWDERRIGYTAEVGFDFLRDGLLIAALVLVLAWSAPAAPTETSLARLSDRVEGTWRQVQDEWNRMFGGLNSYYRREGELFERVIALGGPVHLSDAVIVDIQAEKGRYWRAATYDRYTGRGWESTLNEQVPLGKGSTPVEAPPYKMRETLQQVVTMQLSSSRSIIAAPQLQDISIAVDAYLRYLPSAEETSNRRPPIDVSVAYAHVRLRQGDQYEAFSSLSAADEESLRAASTEYEAGIRERYLQLPDDLPRRVRSLAQAITRGMTNNYDKALAIQNFLRRYTYNESIDAPPPDRDAVDYFLFDSKQGYCDYYASAMVVLARAVGIPARLARGYAQGEQLPDTKIFRVLEKNGHAWPELYFAEYGWIEFEPTAAQPEISRPQRSAEQPASAASAGGAAEPPERPEPLLPESPGGALVAGPGWWYLFLVGKGRLVGILLLAATVLAVLGRAAWGMVEPRGLSAAQVAYLRMTRLGRLLLRLAPAEQMTVYEYSRTLAGEVPAARGEIDQVAQAYVRERYATEVPENEGDAARAAWRRAVPRFAQRALQKSVENLAIRFRRGRRALAGLSWED